MLLKHSAIYLVARGVPGAINFTAIAVYTRMLSPEDYGRYVLVLAAVGLVNVVFFQWLRLCLVRFLPRYSADTRPLLSTVLTAFAGLVFVTAILGVLLVSLWPDAISRSLVALAVPLLWAQAWFELNLALAQSELRPKSYGVMAILKSVSALGLGALMILWGLGARGPLIGLMLGFLVAASFRSRKDWGRLRAFCDRQILLEMLRYGLPLTLTFALAFIVSASDRFLIAALLGESDVGVYAASYDLADQSLTLLMMIVNLAAYPLAVRSLESEGVAAAQIQVKQNATLLLAIGVPACVGIMILAPGIGNFVLGVSFRDAAQFLLPLVVLAALLSGLKAFHFDLAFQLGRWTAGQVWVVGVAALVNLLLNLWWLPIFGLRGAAYATVVAYLVGMVMSAVLGRRVFRVPFPWSETVRIMFAAGVMAVAVEWLRNELSRGVLLKQIAVGVMVYIVIFVILDVARSRRWLLARFQPRLR